MHNSKSFAYSVVRNYICSQIAYEREKIQTASYDTKENADYISDRYSLISTYQKILDIMSREKDRIIK